MKKSELRQIIREEIEAIIQSVPESTDLYTFKKTTQGRPTMRLTLSEKGWERLKKEGVFDEQGKLKANEWKHIGFGGYGWTLDSKEVKYVDGSKAYVIWGHSGDASFGLTPWYMNKSMSGNIKAARAILSTFIKKHLL